MSVLEYCGEAVIATFILLCILIGPGLVLAVAINHVTGFVQRQAVRGMGRTLYLYLFGWLGISIHELGHAAFCVVFRHRIVEMKLFSPDTETGVLGYVRHRYSRRSVYQNIGNFFIGIGPLIFGTIIIYHVSYYLLGLDTLGAANEFNLRAGDLGTWTGIKEVSQNAWESTTGVLEEISAWDNLSSWKFYLFVYLVFCIGSSIRLSPADIRGASKGFGILVLILLCFNLSTNWARSFAVDLSDDLSSSTGRVYAVMFFTLLLYLTASSLILVILAPFNVSRKLFN